MANQAELRERFNPDGSSLRNHQLRMLEMLKYIDGVCKKHNISYWLSSGTETTVKGCVMPGLTSAPMRKGSVPTTPLLGLFISV